MVLVTNEEQHIVWEGYIWSSAAHTPQLTTNIKIEVALSGNFQLPEDGVLVSAVYSFSHDLGDKELRRSVTLEMQHCATSSVLNDLRVVRAVDEPYKFEILPGADFVRSDSYGAITLQQVVRAVNVPYKFEILPGADFARGDGYGAINLHRFSCFSIFLRRICSFFSPRNVFEYCAKIYYTGILPFQFDFEFLIIRDLSTLAKVCDVLEFLRVLYTSLCCRLLKQSFENEIASWSTGPLQKLNLKRMKFLWIFPPVHVMGGP